jgi:hypothetical protein
MKTLIFVGVSRGSVCGSSLFSPSGSFEIRRARLRARNQVHSVSSFRAWRAGGLGGERGGAAGLHDRLGAGGNRWQGPHAGSPLRTLTFGLLTPFYFIRAGLLCLGAGADCGSCDAAHSVPGQDGDEDRIRVSHGESPSTPGVCRRLLHADDVDRPDLWNHLSALRPQSPDHHAGAVFIPRGGDHRQRGDSLRWWPIRSFCPNICFPEGGPWEASCCACCSPAVEEEG